MSLFQLTASITKAAADLEVAANNAANAADIEARAKTALLDAAECLVLAYRTPRQWLVDLSFQHCATATLQLIVKYRLHHAVPLQGSVTYADVADAVAASGKSSGVPTTLVERLLQHAMSFGLFTPASHGQVAHNDASRLLATDPDLEAWLYLCTNIAYPAGAQLPKAIETYGASSEPNETAYSVSIGQRLSQFEHLKSSPEGSEMFARAMKGISAGGAYDVAHVIDGGYPWHELKEGTLVVDVGGGPGHVSLALARKYPKLRFEIQDLAETVEFGSRNCPEELKDRVSFRVHDFFKPQPDHHATDDRPVVFFARFILHDWSDKYAGQIVAAMAQGMRSQDRLILNEVVIPAPGKAGLAAQRIERKCHDRDLLMLMNLNGRERTLSAFEGLFGAASPRLRVGGVHQPTTGGELSLIEAVVDVGNKLKTHNGTNGI
ncbi:S-adenosyl-L-methionine-dependent methyltransferase [Paraphoma chrysanthemicola]|uniref:S-adenosyl-L-methionine-dependent methyltransferase n=1 Tax=Paraphoma chrysanthemicola TaxID=798071 RepID=A0A8K0RG38_9PLEO|nr:S-adenosyl-L-methionine-dependent methyltransferase [Paraphoma chrysanthemicola]